MVGADGKVRPSWERFLREAIARAKENNLEVGVCGEAAADPGLTRFWLETRIDELSVSPGLVPWLKSHARAGFT